MNLIRIITTCMYVLALLPRPLWAADYVLVPERSVVKVFAIYQGQSVEGRVHDISTTIRFDAEHPEQSHVRATADLTSLSFTNKEYDSKLAEPEWLSLSSFSTATLTVTGLSHIPSTPNYYGEGTLTLKGIVRPVTVNFQLKEQGSVAIAQGYFTIKRRDFLLGSGEWTADEKLKDSVRIEFRVLAKQHSP